MINETASTTILSHWRFRQAPTSSKPSAQLSEWIQSKHGLPATEIHVDLLDNGLIPDPFKEMNEKLVQWIEDEDWEYEAFFELSLDDLRSKTHHDLVFESLDTFADIYVNDKKVGQCTSQFFGQRIVLDAKLLQVGRNSVRIYFESAIKKARELEKIHGKFIISNAQTSRVQIRKAQYHYGWDWGPQLMTCGPCRPVSIHSYNAYVNDIHARIHVDSDLTSATVCVDTETVSDNVNTLLKISLIDPQGTVIGSAELKDSKTAQFDVKSPKLWYPRGYGPQNLHKIVAQLIDSDTGNILDTASKSIGIRKARLVQEPFKDTNVPGTSFFFEVNGIAINAVGSCWIPAHSFVTKLTDQDYKDWLNMLVEGNQVMVRVWGGGYYERSIFYDECDRLGLLVWQDFMFACGQYPFYPEFLDLVTKEAEYQVRRLRDHCSIVLWAGNNEDYQIAEWFDLGYDPKDTTSDFLHTKFGARHIYERIFPRVVSGLTDVPYHPGSPWGGINTDDPTVGDIHQWNVWHGRQEKYQDWYKLGGRFISEFGMLAFPNKATLDTFTEIDAEKYPQSQTFDHHNKALGFERRLALYVMENVACKSMEVDDWRYSTQLMQAECLAYAYRCWRKEWKGDGERYIGGALVWQSNDCWPVTSWAICDFFKRPKLAYYAIKRESNPVWLGMYRNDVTERPPYLIIDPRMGKPFDYIKKKYSVDVWGVNATTKDRNVIIYRQVYNVETGELIKELEPEKITFYANQSTALKTPVAIGSEPEEVLYCRIADVSDPKKIIARAGDWPQPLKYLNFPDRKLTVVVKDGEIVLSANKPIKGVELVLPNHPDLLLSDNGLDIFPGDDQIVKAPGLKSDDKVEYRYYRQEE